MAHRELNLQERRKIEDWWLAKVPVAEMARVLKRHKSAIPVRFFPQTPNVLSL